MKVWKYGISSHNSIEFPSVKMLHESYVRRMLRPSNRFFVLVYRVYSVSTYNILSTEFEILLLLLLLFI
jgi:hypothetical protein